MSKTNKLNFIFCAILLLVGFNAFAQESTRNPWGMTPQQYGLFENTSVSALNNYPQTHPNYGALTLPEVSHITNQPDNGGSPTIAQFRFLAAPSHYLKDDPIIFPGQPGGSHLHMFFGNTRADAYSKVGTGSQNDLMVRGASTVQGGKGANPSAYWVPAMLDGPLNGCDDQRQIILPDVITVYYKTRHPDAAQLIPAGLQVIGGNVSHSPGGMVHGMTIRNSGGGTFREGAIWGFYDPSRGMVVDGQPTIPQSNPNGYKWVRASIGFPQCFAAEADGGFVLSSPNNLSHQHILEDTQGWNRDDQPCPNSHPNRIAKVEILLDFRWPTDNDVSGWRLSSDMGADREARVPNPGGSLHGDILFAWNPKVQQAWKDECQDPNDPRNCSIGQTGTQWILDRIENAATITNMVYNGNPYLSDPYDCAENCPPAGTPCHDHSLNIMNGVQDGNCNCVNNCPTAGTLCDDEDPDTINDVEDGNCNCAGSCPTAGTTCNDNNPNTINDTEDGFCNCSGTPNNPPGNCGEFTTSGSKIINPCGNEFFGAGMNAAFNLLSGPFVFQGLHNGEGPCAGAFDIWPGQTNYHNGTECFPGGGVNTSDVWSPQANGIVTVPDRYYAMNGHLSQNAIEAGIRQPADHWHQNILRANLVCDGQDGSPGPTDILAVAIPAIQEALDAGMVVSPEVHDLTQDNATPTAAWNAPTNAFSGEFGCVVNLVDGLVDAFKTDGNATGQGNDPVKQGYVWFDPTNEPWDGTSVGGCPGQDYFSTQTFWIERIRNYHNAENIIIINLHNWGQSLNLLANGCYDAWWTSLKNHSSGDLTRNVVLSWHNYGSQHGVGGYTYAQMDAQLNTVLNTGTPGGYTYPVTVGEYGVAVVPGAGNAGLHENNKNGFEFMMTNIHGPALADKYNIHPMVWNATGDSGFWVSYKLTRGPAAATNDGLAIPFWDIESGNDSYLEPLGAAHWKLSHTIWNKNIPCTVSSCGDCPVAGTTCNDGNAYTNNDIEDGNCNCTGTCLPVNTTCNDRNPNTENDVIDANCNCSGTPVNTGNNNICKEPVSPTIDGNSNDWSQTNYVIGNQIIGNVNSPNDLSGHFQIQWDNNYLYLLVDVQDDNLVSDSEAAYQDDGIEVYVDGGNEKASTYDQNDHQVTLRYNDNNVYNWSEGQINPSGISFVQAATSLGYSMEIKIAWSFIGVNPTDGMPVGIDVHINDDDDGGDRDKKIAWYATIDDSWNNPSLFNTMTLKSCETPNEDCNQVKNSNFADGLADWAVQNCEATNVSGGVNVDVPYVAENFWDIAVKQKGLSYEQGKTYRVSFNAKADAPRMIYIKAGKSIEPWTTYHIEHMNLTTELESHSYTFSMDDATDSNAFLEFFFGESDINLFLGEVSLKEAVCAELRLDPPNNTVENLTVAPNPVSNLLTIKFDSASDYQNSTIRLFDMNGRMVLENHLVINANNELQLDVQAIPTGIYILRADVGNYSLTHKIVKH